MGKGKLYIETYGCQMNFADSEVVAAILSPEYDIVDNVKDADVILVNTCSIRDNAEQRVFNRLNELTNLKNKKKHLQIGILGCMAERLKDDLFQKSNIDLIVGPDAYRMLPEILKSEISPIDVQLSQTETYKEIIPFKYEGNGVSAFVSIMRGCNNFCSYCVVPYTRGRERSREIDSILNEIQHLVNDGYKEVTLLGQNVNSYHFEDYYFATLMQIVAEKFPTTRIRFATSHPKDLSDELLEVMAKYNNICKSIHLPAQSGSTAMLKRMNRKYSREDYLNRIASIKKYLPDCAISTDLIAGFCDETEEEHQATLSLMKEVGFDFAYMFKYSMREGTAAHKHMQDNIPEEIKIKRLEEIIALQQELSHISNKKDVGKSMEVLVEGPSKRNKNQYFGRNSQNKVVIFDKGNCQKGDFVMVKITACTAATLLGELL
ncbi:MAG: tRNA (N6-isopentenyl adenosine(37)-C2)-methylthiotransferase MiaB [Bacteroidales bacterium]|nr:tRNA (N6-isopentenyl adenosine(37)-C2)-methylthiotransferase MiaB [Bacteroidales bacterium]